MSQYLLRNADIDSNPPMAPNLSHPRSLTSHVHTSCPSANRPPPQTRSALALSTTPPPESHHPTKVALTVATKPIETIHAPNANATAIKVQTEFMDAMTNAIIRFLDKHEDHSKSKAEQSVFVALGYDIAIESEANDLERNLSHFRRHHIMRNRDAIRTFRIKKVHETVMKQHPKYRSDEILMHLTRKLNCIYLPSPSPPPPPVSNAKPSMNDAIATTENIDSNPLETRGSKEAQQQQQQRTVSLQSKCITEANATDTCMKSVDHIQMDTAKTKIKNVNYTINNQCGTNNKSPCAHNNKLGMSRGAKKQSVNRDASPSQIYTNINHNNHVTKYKKKKNNIIKQNIATATATASASSSHMSSNKKLNIILAQNTYHYPSSNSYLQTPSQAPFYMMEDEVTQKIKLHKKAKSRKRKFTFNEFEGNNLNSFEFDSQPPKKRARKDLIHHRKGRGRAIAINKTRARGRGKNRNQYEEEETSDIDSNLLNDQSQTTTNSHI